MVDKLRRNMLKVAGFSPVANPMIQFFRYMAAHAGATLPQGMKDLGFRLGNENGNKDAEILVMPCLEMGYWSPDFKSTEEVGRFKLFKFDKSTNIAYFETTEGEKTALQIDPDNGIVKYKGEFKGDVQEGVWTYESDPRVREFVHDRLADRVYKDISTTFDKSTCQLKINDKKGLVFKEKACLPEGVDLEVLVGKFIKLKSQGDILFSNPKYPKMSGMEYITVSYEPLMEGDREEEGDKKKADH